MLFVLSEACFFTFAWSMKKMPDFFCKADIFEILSKHSFKDRLTSFYYPVFC